MRVVEDEPKRNQSGEYLASRNIVRRCVLAPFATFIGCTSSTEKSTDFEVTLKKVQSASSKLHSYRY